MIFQNDTTWKRPKKTKKGIAFLLQLDETSLVHMNAWHKAFHKKIFVFFFFFLIPLPLQHFSTIIKTMFIREQRIFCLRMKELGSWFLFCPCYNTTCIYIHIRTGIQRVLLRIHLHDFYLVIITHFVTFFGRQILLIQLLYFALCRFVVQNQL